jgi:integrase
VNTRATSWTDTKVASLKLPEGKAEQRVRIDAGLYLYLRKRVDGKVSKQWQYRAQVNGARRWLSLGTYPAVPLAQASAERLAHAKVGVAAKLGEADHPAIVARQDRKTKNAMPTVAELFEEWIADKRMGSPRKGGVPVRERTITVLKENYELDIKSRIGESKVAKLTRQALQDCIDAPRRRGAPGAAAQVYRTLRGLMNFATKRGHLEGADPMRGIENPRPYRPAPVVAANDQELLALFAALDASRRMWPATKLAIEFQLLTGARPAEVRLAEWSEFDRKRNVWTIPAERVKTGRPFRIDLSAAAGALLDRAAPLRAEKSSLVFPGAKGKAMEKTAIARALRRLAARAPDADGKKLRPHDLRRTFRTMLSRLGIAPHIAELCMNHLETETMRRVYDGHDYSTEMKEAWHRAGAHLALLRLPQAAGNSRAVR